MRFSHVAEGREEDIGVGVFRRCGQIFSDNVIVIEVSRPFERRISLRRGLSSRIALGMVVERVMSVAWLDLSSRRCVFRSRRVLQS